jgi:hypothetical protein
MNSYLQSAGTMVLVMFALSSAACTPDNKPDNKTADSTKKTSGNDSNVEVLFDGNSLDQWRGYNQEEIGKGWKITDGILEFDGTGGGDIVTKNEYENFEFSFDWKVSPGANSGVMYRVTLGDSAPYLSGPEFQILDDSKHADGKNELTSAAALYGLYKCENKELKDVGEWNTSKIVQRGNKIEHWLNGKKVVTAEIGSEDWKKRVADSKFKDWEKFGVSPKGRIALQDHGNKVWFRNISIKQLDKSISE